MRAVFLHHEQAMACSKSEKILVDAISRVEVLCPITGFDYKELSRLLLEELASGGYSIVPLSLTDEMFAAGLAAQKRSLPLSIMSVYNAELAAWSAETAE